MKPYTLSLYTSILDPGHAFAAGLTRDARGWRRSIRSIGGYWQGSFSLHGDRAVLQRHFNTWLGYHLVERCGGVISWEGMVYEMEYTHAAMRRVRSLDLLGNAVRVTYAVLSWDGTRWLETEHDTPWAACAESIARHGRREHTLRATCPLGSAVLIRDTVLSANAWPWPRPVGSVSPAPAGSASLVVRVCGYVFTANWLTLHEYDYFDHTASDWLAAIVGAGFGLSPNHGGADPAAGDCQFLKTGVIRPNPLQLTAAPPYLAPRRAWEQLGAIARAGDAGGHPWQLQVDTGRVVNYQPLDLSPRYVLRGGALYDTLAATRPVAPWQVRPAVVRDLAYPAAAVEPGSFLSDARDMYVEEVEAFDDGAGPGRLALKTALFDEADLLAATLDPAAGGGDG